MQYYIMKLVQTWCLQDWMECGGLLLLLQIAK